MNKELEEARLTAYLLGELRSPDKEELEAQLEQSQELRLELERLKETIGLVTEVFQTEQELRLRPDQRREIEGRAGSRKRSFAGYYRYVAAAAAACLVVAVYLEWEGLLTVKAPDLEANYSREVERPVPIQSPRPGIETAPREDDVIEAETSANETSEAEKPDQQALALQSTSGRDEIGGQEPRKAPGADSNGSASLVAEPESLTLSRGDKREVKSAYTDEGEQRRQTPMRDAGQSTPPASVLEEAAFAMKGRSAVPGSVPAESARLMTLSSTSGVVTGFADQPLQPPDILPVPPGDFNTEAYDHLRENPFIPVSDQPLSTFSIDADTASYSNVRRFLREKALPPKDAVRIEELINYFTYDYAGPTGDVPFAVHIETATAPWNESHQLVRFGLKGKELNLGERPPANLVFLLDVSGSMQPANKLPLLRRAFRLLVEQLEEGDKVAIVVYAGASGLVLPSTPCSEKEKIQQAIERLEAGGSTNGGAGIQLAYKTAEEHFIRDGINRVILATDGDFNVGTTNQGDLTRLIEEKAESGVFLTVLGFGMGNLKDSTLEKLADRGNGNYAYIDTIEEAKRVLVEAIGGTLVTIAKDVKVQVEFNPTHVAAYRLIGYENRLLRNQDFNDDQIDAGEIGAGHTVTVLYELVPAGTEIQDADVDPLKYQVQRESTSAGQSEEILTLKLRYKEPSGSESKLLQFPVRRTSASFEEADESLRFAAAVASFGMLLRDSAFKGTATYEMVLSIAEESRGEDRGGYRSEFIRLVKLAKALQDLEALEP